MKHFYIFECKSVQAYIFSSTRLIDIISASERLDRLIDTHEESLLAKICDQLGLATDLHDAEKLIDGNGIQFLRCKGGAIQAFSESLDSLTKFRALWQLTVQQLFPSLAFVDALVTADNLQKVITKGFEELGKAQSLPRTGWLSATAVIQRYPRTGKASVPTFSAANRVKKETWKNVDPDINFHRSAYTTWDVKSNSRLQKRFFDSAHGDISFPTDHDKEFETGAIKDIALLHADGNGLGQLLMTLRSALQSKDERTSKLILREFSELIANATVVAAQQATSWLYKAHQKNTESNYLPMRPIVLGGDDLTILIAAPYAFKYLKVFTEEFQAATEAAISTLLNNHNLNNQSFPTYLTASGGIVFCKLGHPFIATAALVESATDSAKELSKLQVTGTCIAPASVTFCRTSSVVTSDYQEFTQRTANFEVAKNAFGVERVVLAQAGYLLGQEDSNFTALQELAKLCSETISNPNVPVSMSRWRQMETHLSVGDFSEAQRIFDRSCKLNPQQVEKLTKLAQQTLNEHKGEFCGWYVKKPDGTAQSFIHDLLILDHFHSFADEHRLQALAKESA